MPATFSNFEPQFEILRTDNNRYGREWDGVRLNDDYHRLYVLSEGSARVVVDDEVFELQAGSSYLFPKTRRFEYACRDSMRLLHACFEMRVSTLAEPLSVLPYHARVKLLRTEQVYDAMAQIHAWWQDPRLFNRLRVNGLLMQLLSPHFDRAATAQSRRRRDLLQRLAPALDAIRDDLRGELQVADLSSQCGMSRSNFARLFREALGLSAQDYARSQRVSRAKRLILQTDWPLARISDELGYSSQSYFSREFKALAGQSPNRFRAARILMDW